MSYNQRSKDVGRTPQEENYTMTERTLNKRTLVWAHRGVAYAPENTLPSFRMAVDMKADGVELDVHLTKDKKILVCHNGTIGETSDGHGAIRDMTYDEISEFNFAYRADGRYDKFGFVKAPLLDDVFELLAPTGLTVNVEIKSDETELPAMCIALSEKYGMKDRVYYSAFNHLNLERLHETDISVPTAPLYCERILYPWIYASLIGAKAIHPAGYQVDCVPGIIHECHIRGIRVNPWTIDDEDTMDHMIEAGVDALITDLADVARRHVLAHFGEE